VALPGYRRALPVHLCLCLGRVGKELNDLDVAA
jgi:hypothetical protein